MPALIYRPAKTSMQSGKGNTQRWVLEFRAEEAKQNDEVMGWSGSGDTRQQVRMRFDSKEEAVAYAKRAGLTYSVREPQTAKPIIKAYSDNFTS